MRNLATNMDLSLVLCTWNNCRRLAVTLDALAHCAIPDGLRWELVLVDNNCTDDTERVAASFSDRVPLLYVREPRQGLSRARNAGLGAASGEFVLFTDDDVRPCSAWIATYWECYRSRPTGFLFGGPIDSEFEGARPDEELLSAAPPSVAGLDYGVEERVIADESPFVSANWGCPREILLRLGGFDVEKGLDPSCGRVRGGEETDLMQRLSQRGWRALYLPQARLAHFVPASKCTLQHILARAEAGGLDMGMAQRNATHGWFIGGIPGWAVKEWFRDWGRWVLARIQGRKGYQEYVRWRAMVRFIAGARDASAPLVERRHGEAVDPGTRKSRDGGPDPRSARGNGGAAW